MVPFDEKKAAALLGHPGESFEDLSPYHLPEVYCLRIRSGAKARGGPFIVRHGEVVTTKGYAIASAWPRRVVMPLHDAPDVSPVAQVTGWSPKMDLWPWYRDRFRTELPVRRAASSCRERRMMPSNRCCRRWSHNTQTCSPGRT
jgi:hypothetical protein